MSEQIPLPDPAATPAAAPPAAPPVAPVADWRSALPSDISSHPVLADTKSVESLARQHIEVQKLIGSKGIIPPADDSPEEQNRYFGELGRPEKPEGYQFASVGIEKRTPAQIKFLDSLRPIMHGTGATDAQADSIVKGYFELVDAQLADRDTANDERAKLTVAALKKKWGMAYEPRQKLAEQAGIKLFGEETLNLFAEAIMADGSRVGDHPDFIEKLYENFGSQIPEDQLVPGTSVADAPMTPVGAQAEIDRLLTDKAISVPYFDRTHIEHQAVMKRLTALYKAATPPVEGGSA